MAQQATPSTAAPPAPAALLEALAAIPGMEAGQRRLVLLWGQLGDFDSLEYAQALVPRLPTLEAARIAVQAFGIGNGAGRDRFCAFTGFPPQRLQVRPDAQLHRALDLYAGLQLPIGAWGNLLLMCAGIGSAGTLREVLRGYTGDRRAPQRIADDAVIEAPPLPPIRGSLFARAGGRGFLRPFELATIRLRNMGEVLSHWRTYVPCEDALPQRGGTWLLAEDDTLLYHHRDPGILAFSETMAQPLSFLEPHLRSPLDG
ncbi:AhpC/TSA family protein [Cyanobium sp. ATX 6A2]|uniref:AhpC/TSA family protein n=1 Tax=Cyanobium sp. ATX 6A2 TaxID=2823700 RepID=UPI0020CE9923|nr:AhpC/TSA family protein [Cyanobium sp. ATX 6A2]